MSTKIKVLVPTAVAFVVVIASILFVVTGDMFSSKSWGPELRFSSTATSFGEFDFPNISCSNTIGTPKGQDGCLLTGGYGNNDALSKAYRLSLGSSTTISSSDIAAVSYPQTNFDT